MEPCLKKDLRGNMNHISEIHLMIFLLQFGLILALSKAAGVLFTKFKQPTITADLLIGIILGPTIFGKFFPQYFTKIFPQDVIQTTMLDTIAWTGIMFLMLQAGLEINFSKVWAQKKQALIISLSDIFLPMIIAFFPVYFLPQSYLIEGSNRFLFSLFISSIMTISALPIVIRVLHEMNILKSDLGVLIVSALTINDIIGWLFFTIILGIFTQGKTDFLFIMQIFSASIFFAIFALIIGTKLSNKVIEKLHAINENSGSLLITYICLLGILFGTITLKIGIHSLFGFFMAGLVAGQSTLLKEKDRFFFVNFVHSIFIPLFFVSIGLKVDFIQNFDLFIVALITVIGIAGRFIGAWVGSVIMKKNQQDSIAIGVAHTPGGEMHIVVGILAYESGLISQQVYIAIIIAAIISSIVFGPTLSLIYSLNKRFRISQFMSLNQIFINLNAKDKSDCLKQLAKHASQITQIDQEFIYDEIVNREKILSSGIGKSLAIPHARILEGDRPFLLFCRLEEDLEWDAPDGIKVKFVFFILTSTRNHQIQLKMLSAISKLLSQKSFVDQLIMAQKKEDIYKAFKKY